MWPGWCGSALGLKASSAVSTRCAPCESKKPAFLIKSYVQSRSWPRSPVFGSYCAAIEPSEKAATKTLGGPCEWAAA